MSDVRGNARFLGAQSMQQMLVAGDGGNASHHQNTQSTVLP